MSLVFLFAAGFIFRMRVCVDVLDSTMEEWIVHRKTIAISFLPLTYNDISCYPFDNMRKTTLDRKTIHGK